ncbi:hypothetical protein BDK51DRAFT_21336 [Blyttiomyces helicus]|uniref:Queuosine 5'-phosphate N-glycosylase/hydrolase n=1 Tax=Blyttiomyces helicus TaxID=388810 RepID=A0A4V1IRT1_9FUNG|nr:hypothetical protein BDK51DRAFT_21336 [Blyttiomyces helicus]|eukprot:RKO91137.1 hypothetical protein BDK51DRAFT_21336 [Blyttiomyces helicus]
MTVPLLPQENLLDAVKISCRALRDKNLPDIAISSSHIDTFLRSLDGAKYAEVSSGDPNKAPLKFDSIEQEVGFVALIDLLNFGSGWRVELHAALDRGAFNAIRFGCMALHISSVDVSAKWMRRVTLAEVASYFDLPLLRDVPHETLPIVTMKPHSLRALSEQIMEVLHETGKVLEDKGYPSLAAFVMDAVTRPGEGGSRGPAAELVDRVARAFPSMRDCDTYKGVDVFILKRAQLLAGNLYRRFSATDPRFAFSDIKDLTVFSDNVLPTVLTKLGVLTLSESLQGRITAREDLGQAADEKWAVRLRGAAVDACEEIVAKAKTLEGLDLRVAAMAGIDLDYYLWSLGKEEGYRTVERMVVKGTPFF